MGFNSIEEAIEDIRQGRIVIVVDDEDRENEGDFVVAAETITPEIVNKVQPYKFKRFVNDKLIWKIEY